MGHAGGDFGTLSVLGIDRAAVTGVIVMLNSESGDQELAFRSLEVLFHALDDVVVAPDD